MERKRMEGGVRGWEGKKERDKSGREGCRDMLR
jgi:hypothetical protein